ncbi:unnamed protein product, partial [Urochloa humidicola]
YYTDPSGTFWECSAKAIESGSEGADRSLQEQCNKVGVQNKTSDVLNRLANAVVIDANRNQHRVLLITSLQACFHVLFLMLHQNSITFSDVS